MCPTGGDNYTGGGGGGDSGKGYNSGGGPKWQPHEYHPSIREDGQKYPKSNSSPVSVLETYNPAGDIPPQNDKQLGVLIDYRFEHYVRPMGYAQWNVANIFPNDSMVDKIARARLLNHIYDNQSVLPTAYKELDCFSGIPKWNSVTITSYLINSLNNSNK
jgi:hypothetical protein